MILEVSQLLGAPIVSAEGKKLAVVDKIVFDGKEARVSGFQTSRRAVLQHFGALAYNKTLSVEHDEIVIDDEKSIERDLKLFDQLRHQYGTVLGVVARTESGQRMSKIHDLIIDADTGLIVRFYIGQFLRERIIPRQFLVSITPKAIIFKDIVNAPTFNQIAAEASVAWQSVTVKLLGRKSERLSKSTGNSDRRQKSPQNILFRYG